MVFEIKVEELGIEIDFKFKKMFVFLFKLVLVQMCDFVLEDVFCIGQIVEFIFFVNFWIDGYFKGCVMCESIVNDKNVFVEQLDFVD